MLPQPHIDNDCRLSHLHGLASSAFARHYSRNHYLFSLPVGTEMFHFPTFPPHTLYIQMRVTRHHSCRVSPFGNPRISARLTAPRGISQPPTSFIGSWCQGIHRTLLNTYKTKMLASTVQFSNNTPTRTRTPHRHPEPLTREARNRYDRRPERIVFLPRKKHSRVLSGPNSVSIYHPWTGHTGPATLGMGLSAFHP